MYVCTRVRGPSRAERYGTRRGTRSHSLELARTRSNAEGRSAASRRALDGVSYAVSAILSDGTKRAISYYPFRDAAGCRAD